MISDINADIKSIQQSFSQPQIYKGRWPAADTQEPLTSFADEDQAIISSEANLMNELDKFNSGQGDAVDLALAGVMAKTTVEAEVNVINAKKQMFDTILDMGK